MVVGIVNIPCASGVGYYFPPPPYYLRLFLFVFPISRNWNKLTLRTVTQVVNYIISLAHALYNSTHTGVVCSA